jgi:hypothetical protein
VNAGFAILSPLEILVLEAVRMKMLVSILAVLLNVFSQDPGGLSPQTASAAIDKSFQNAAAVMTVELGRVGIQCANKEADVDNFDPTRDIEFIAAQKAGLLTIQPDGPNYWKVEWADKKPSAAEALSKIPHKAANGCDYQKLVLLVAKKSVVDVTNIRRLTDTKAEVEFTWKWAPSHAYIKLPDSLSAEEQKAFEAYLSSRAPSQGDPQFRVADITENPETHPGKSTLKRAADGWRIGLDQETASRVIKTGIDTLSKEITVPIGRVGEHCVDLADGTEIPMDLSPDKMIGAIVALKAGYVSVREDGPGYWIIDLTKRGLNVGTRPSPQKPQNGCDYQYVSFAVAKRSLVQITDITETDHTLITVEVAYLFKWQPTDLGASLGATGEIYTKLTPAQRSAAKILLRADPFSPALPLPVPAASAAIPATATLKRSGNSWQFLPHLLVPSS